MCGIAGIFHFDGRPVDRDLLERMTGAVRHRGPDGAGMFLGNDAGLGHRRLSIIDVAGGAQPIANEDDSVHVICNGEIYNFVELREELLAKGHRFRTRSDTEVIVHAYEQWGLECVEYFNGIFAFALWDAKLSRLVLARDHLGVKPLYYHHVDGRLLFASEIKAILESGCSREVHLPALASLFTLRYVPAPHTLFQDIFKLPAGHLMVASARGVEVRRYWRWKPRGVRQASEERLSAEYRELLEDSVRLQMRSDVPVGLYLSSGLDSTALLALMTKFADGPVHTFSIGFEEGDDSNETDEARETAKRYGASHTEMRLSPKDYADYFERYLADLEEPVGEEAAAAFYFLSLMASKTVKVVLCGQGADEPWAGYQRYVGIKLSQIYSKLPGLLTQSIAAAVDRFGSNEALIRGAHSLAEHDVFTRILKVYSFFDASMKAALFRPWLKDAIGVDETVARQAMAHLYHDVEDRDPLTQMLYIDTRATLADDLLMVADKLSMANAIETRVPYLDYRLVQFIESLSPNLKLRGLQGKYLHKNALADLVSPEVAYRRKKGFSHPVDKWLRGPLRGVVADCLLSETAAVNRYFNPEPIRRMVEDHESGRQNYLRHLYLLITFELWHRRFIRA